MPDFDFGEPAAPAPRREAGHGASGFWTMFGGSLGRFAAAGFVMLAGFIGCVLVCGGCLVAVKSLPTAPPTARGK